MNDIENQIAATLTEHERNGGIRDMKIHCACGWSEPIARMRSSKAANLAHQAAMLAPLIREAQAVAWEQGMETKAQFPWGKEGLGQYRHPYRAAEIRSSDG